MFKLHLFVYLFEYNIKFLLCLLFFAGLLVARSLKSFLGLKVSLFCLVTLARNNMYHENNWQAKKTDLIYHGSGTLGRRTPGISYLESHWLKPGI